MRAVGRSENPERSTSKVVGVICPLRSIWNKVDRSDKTLVGGIAPIPHCSSGSDGLAFISTFYANAFFYAVRTFLEVEY